MRYDRLRARVEAAIKTAPAGAAMVQAFKQALSEMGMTGESTIILEVDGQQFGKAVFRHYNSESRRVGATLISR